MRKKERKKENSILCLSLMDSVIMYVCISSVNILSLESVLKKIKKREIKKEGEKKERERDL